MMNVRAMFFALLCGISWALQPTKELAVLNVTAQDESGRLLKGETVVFKGTHSRKVFSGKTDHRGQFSLHLPKGESYDIFFVSLGGDSTLCGEVKIPLNAGVGNWTVTFENSTYVLKDVYFDTGKATLKPQSYAELDRVAANLNREENLNLSFEVAGHTDDVGGEEYNLNLSQARAEAVRDYLVSKGVDAKRLTAKGYGYSQPVAPNTSEAGRAKNRRTELRRLDEK